MELFRELLEAPGKESLQKFAEMCGRCREIQLQTLLDILAASKDSEIGKKYDFASIKTVEDYQKRVPVTEYEDIEDEIERMAAGAQDVLFSGATEYFISTSGTTGTSKKIPESKNSMDAKKSVNRLRTAFLFKNFMARLPQLPRAQALLRSKKLDLQALNAANLMDRFHFYSVTSATADQKTSGGIDIGYASGKTFESSDFAGSLAYPKELMGLADGEATMYFTMLFALRYDDVVVLTANNAGRMYARVTYAMDRAEDLIHDLREGVIRADLSLTPAEHAALQAQLTPCPARADELQALLDKGREYFTPKYYWPYLLIARFWLTGSVGVNVKKLAPLLPEDVLYFDIGYGASEGKLNIPYTIGSGNGILGTAALFYEFKPFDGAGASANEADLLTADRLENGRQYELFLTNFGGLYRYPLHDVVRVNGFVGNTPCIEFITKSREILNLAQEKIPAASVLGCINRLGTEQGCPVKQAQIYPDCEAARYEICLELETESAAAKIKSMDFAGLLDAALREQFDLYARNRKFKSLNAPHITLMKRGWQEQLFALREKKGTPKSQIKLDAMIQKMPENDWML